MKGQVGKVRQKGGLPPLVSLQPLTDEDDSLAQSLGAGDQR